jgi:hypothetical protein
MELERQLDRLSEDASRYGIPTPIFDQAVSPVIDLFAKQLQHLEYYILQNLHSDWVMYTIQDRQEQSEKKVIYAFTSVKDAATFQGKADPNLLAMAIPTVQLLFQLFALQDIDSLIFLETPGNLSQGTIIERERLLDIVQQQIRQLNPIPPDIA